MPDLSVGGVERGEQCGRAVAFVIVGHGPAATFLHWQARLSAIQRLNLALFLKGQYQRMLRRVQIETYSQRTFNGQMCHR